MLTFNHDPTPDPDLTYNLNSLDFVVTQSLAEAGRDREDIRSELFRALEAARLGNSEQDRGERGRRQVDLPVGLGVP